LQGQACSTFKNDYLNYHDSQKSMPVGLGANFSYGNLLKYYPQINPEKAENPLLTLL